MQFVPLMLTAGAGIGAAAQIRNVGELEAQEAEGEATQEADAFRAREIERRRDLLKALASQSAQAGAGGVAFSGSIASIARRDIRDATNDLLIDRANTRTRIAALRNRAKQSRRGGRLGAAVSLLDTAQKAVAQI